jgi:5-methylcytosine-specific restriction endonuclease McrA
MPNVKHKPQDLIGNKYGKWTVIGVFSRRKALCRCECGTERGVLTTCLVRGKSKSCSCSWRGTTHRRKDISGQRFGKLVAIEPIGKRKNNMVWKLRCDCGNYTQEIVSNLTQNKRKSCGCLFKEGGKHFFKHGKSKTREYERYYEIKRRQSKYKLDCEWTSQMDKEIRELQPNCVLCGMTEIEHKYKYGHSLTIDHVLPLSKGNGLKPGNAVVMCLSCNANKNNKLLDEIPKNIKDRLITKAEEFKQYWENNYDSSVGSGTFR